MNVYGISKNIASTIQASTDLQEMAASAFDKPFSVFLGGIDSYILESGARYPFALVTPNGSTVENGENAYTVAVQISIDAGANDDTSKGETEDGVLAVGMGETLAEMAEKVADILMESAELGAVPKSVETTYSLTAQYPIQTADLAITLGDIKSF